MLAGNVSTTAPRLEDSFSDGNVPSLSNISLTIASLINRFSLPFWSSLFEPDDLPWESSFQRKIHFFPWLVKVVDLRSVRPLGRVSSGETLYSKKEHHSSNGSGL
ncbi:MAG: hypothetical protein P8M80_15155 [Pirellulaceae bacterium]|nr:hypothetical protein [Pirellulaceae bacterium]